ncbi:HNH homing endonuclease [Lausannevirus]|uniref:HNH homing endonuclease n=2 Tax=Lausannevirus TaxID=999883 RepID=A0A0N9PVW8_9VIRU|nr:HNH endonuclease [Lausannevirus]AEA07268.1 HNH homing endonuclease [Lausannevirus]ALH07076.1 HNH homing endonuclease [Port-miou virus]
MCDCGKEEIWKPIEGYEYEVSSCGRVRNETKEIIQPRELGGLGVIVRLPGKNARLARVAALAFVPNPDELPNVKRKDKNSQNNHANNLCWSRISGDEKKYNHPSVEQWSKEGKLLKIWKNTREAAEIYGTRSAIYRITECCKHKRKEFEGFVWEWEGSRDLEGEIWKKYKGENKMILKVSNMGRVHNRDNVKTFGKKDKSGYMKYSKMAVHRLVAELFCEGELTNDAVVNHRDSDRSNNRAENLEICSHSWNSRHSYMRKKDYEEMKIKDEEGEVWKEIDFAPGYRVSNKGKVALKDSEYCLRVTPGTYPRITIKGKMYPIKKLVADAFIPNPEKKKNVHCRDGNPMNVSVENLQRCNHGEEESRKMPNRRKEIILQMDLEGNILNEFEGIWDAVSKTKGSCKTTLGIAAAKEKEYKGFVWKYKSSIDLPGEIWKDVTFQDKKYTVSSCGRLLLLKGTRKSFGSPANGYMQYNNVKVHRIIAAAFLPPPLPSQIVVNHKDGNKQNNRVENLEWSSLSANSRHAHETGLISLPSREEFRNK